MQRDTKRPTAKRVLDDLRAARRSVRTAVKRLEAIGLTSITVSTDNLPEVEPGSRVYDYPLGSVWGRLLDYLDEAIG